jgi:hypothetical protein
MVAQFSIKTFHVGVSFTLAVTSILHVAASFYSANTGLLSEDLNV